MKLFVKRILSNARLPEVANAGSDLGYDLFAAEEVALIPGRVAKIRTGIAVEFDPPRGALLRDRSSMASNGITISAGVIDAGYRGEIQILLTLAIDAPPSNEKMRVFGRTIQVGDKIAQMIPVVPDTLFQVEESHVLSATERGDKGFGSSGV